MTLYCSGLSATMFKAFRFSFSTSQRNRIKKPILSKVLYNILLKRSNFQVP